MQVSESELSIILIGHGPNRGGNCNKIITYVASHSGYVIDHSTLFAPFNFSLNA